MQFLGRDTDFTAFPKLAAVRKAGGCVDIHRRAIHAKGEFVRRFGVFAHDTIAVARRVRRNVRERFVYAVYDFYGADLI